MNEHKPMMRCGHAANATNEGKPCCCICSGLSGDDWKVTCDEPDLSGRVAKCAYNNTVGMCKSTAPSSTELAFFEHKPDCEFDRYYCGCLGWD